MRCGAKSKTAAVLGGVSGPTLGSFVIENSGHLNLADPDERAGRATTGCAISLNPPPNTAVTKLNKSIASVDIGKAIPMGQDNWCDKKDEEA